MHTINILAPLTTPPPSFHTDNKLVVAAGGAKDHIPMDVSSTMKHTYTLAVMLAWHTTKHTHTHPQIFAELGGGFAIMLLGITSLAGKFQPIFSESVAAR